MTVTIVDYGMGNLRSVAKAIQALEADVRLTDQADAVRQAERLVVPGVGACGQAMAELRRRGLVEAIRAYLDSGRPYLGICLGMQLLFEMSEEDGGTEGLGVLSGRVVRFQPSNARAVKVPHMGWNTLRYPNGRPAPLLSRVPEGSFVYFVHSYYAVPEDATLVSSWTEYGGTRFASSVWSGRRYATQFHPEKSQRIGRRILENFLAV